MWGFSFPSQIPLSCISKRRRICFSHFVIQDDLNARDCVREWFLMNDGDHRDKLLACGALIVTELRLEVLKETEFTCSAGIAHNKVRGVFSCINVL